MLAIEVTGLRASYGPVVAVDDIDLTINEGEIFGILGPNGSGKSTTVESVAGLRRPDRGHIRVAGLDPRQQRDEVRRILGVQLQSADLQPKLTVSEALDLFASFYDDPRDRAELAERLGLTPHLRQQFAKLSGGQQQRLSIALALIGRPRIALLDELSTGLDPQSRREVWDLIREINDEGTTIVLVTHLMEEAQYLCDRLALIKSGRIIAQGTPADLIGSTAGATVLSFATSHAFDPNVFLSIEGISEITQRDAVRITGSDEAILTALDTARGITGDIRRVRITESSLDEAYLSLISANANEEGTV